MRTLPRRRPRRAARLESASTRAKYSACVVVPHVPRAKALLERAVAHARAQNLVHRIAQRGVGAREHGDVVSGGYRNGLDVEAARAPQRALGDDVVEQHRIHPPRRRDRCTDARRRRTKSG